MHSFEVHSNESVCIKNVRLGLEQVLWPTNQLGKSSTCSSPMESQSSLHFPQKSSRYLMKLLQRHMDGTCFGPSTIIVLPALILSTQMWMRILLGVLYSRTLDTQKNIDLSKTTISPNFLYKRYLEILMSCIDMSPLLSEK